MSNEYVSPRIKIGLSFKVNFSISVIVGSCLFLLLQFFALAYKRSNLVSASNRMLLVIWIVAVGFVLLRRMLRPISGEPVSVILIVVYTVVSWLYAVTSNPSGAIDNALKMAGFLMFPLMLDYSCFFSMDKRGKNVIFATFILLALLFLRLYHSDLRHEFQGPYAVVQIEAVTLGYSNPNQAALYLLLCSMGLFAAAFYFHKPYLRIFCGAAGCYTAWIMLQTQSRTTALLLAAFAVMILYIRKRDIPKWWIHVSYTLPAVYLLLSVLYPFWEDPVTFLDEGIFNGRAQIFDRYFQQLNLITFLFGDMNYFSFENLHNGYIAIAASAGVLTCVSYVKLLRTIMLRNCPDKNAPLYERIAFIGFLCAVMNTCSEAALFVGGSQYAFLLFCLVMLFVKPRGIQGGHEERSA